MCAYCADPSKKLPSFTEVTTNRKNYNSLKKSQTISKAILCKSDNS